MFSSRIFINAIQRTSFKSPFFTTTIRNASSYWILRFDKGEQSERIKVDFDPETHRVSGIIPERMYQSMKSLEEEEKKEDIVLSRYSESYLFPGPQLEETIVAEDGSFTNWTEDHPTFGKHARATESGKKEPEKDEIEFGATLVGSNITRFRNMPTRSA